MRTLPALVGVVALLAVAGSASSATTPVYRSCGSVSIGTSSPKPATVPTYARAVVCQTAVKVARVCLTSQVNGSTYPCYGDLPGWGLPIPPRYLVLGFRCYRSGTTAHGLPPITAHTPAWVLCERDLPAAKANGPLINQRVAFWSSAGA